jgi:vacuolar-type H+-ATPase subunit I/STV1
MSALTIFLAKLIGLYCVIVALTMMANRRTMVYAVNALIRNPPLVLLSGVIAVALGLAVVVSHNVWSGGTLPVVVTVVGWLSLIKGVVLFVVPAGRMAKLYEALQYERFYLAYDRGPFDV